MLISRRCRFSEAAFFLALHYTLFTALVHFLIMRQIFQRPVFFGQKALASSVLFRCKSGAKKSHQEDLVVFEVFARQSRWQPVFLGTAEADKRPRNQMTSYPTRWLSENISETIQSVSYCLFACLRSTLGNTSALNALLFHLLTAWQELAVSVSLA